MVDVKWQFLFGQPVLPAKPIADGPRPLFVLGAYPSALHVRWYGSGGNCLINAVGVDNEPEPFWPGLDELQRIRRWRDAVAFRAEWGRIEPCGPLNGSSGEWLDRRILGVLNTPRTNAWITDCLDVYHESDDAAKRLDSDAIAAMVKRLDIPARCHRAHPSESEIVNAALSGHTLRLLGELQTAQPDCVVTLGNAALRVFNALVESGGAQIRKLSPDDSYGTVLPVQVNGRDVDWIPLAHPAAPAVYQTAHDLWTMRRAQSA